MGDTRLLIYIDYLSVIDDLDIPINVYSLAETWSRGLQEGHQMKLALLVSFILYLIHEVKPALTIALSPIGDLMNFELP